MPTFEYSQPYLDPSLAESGYTYSAAISLASRMVRREQYNVKELNKLRNLVKEELKLHGNASYLTPYLENLNTILQAPKISKKKIANTIQKLQKTTASDVKVLFTRQAPAISLNGEIIIKGDHISFNNKALLSKTLKTKGLSDTQVGFVINTVCNNQLYTTNSALVATALNQNGSELAIKNSQDKFTIDLVLDANGNLFCNKTERGIIVDLTDPESEKYAQTNSKLSTKFMLPHDTKSVNNLPGTFANIKTEYSCTIADPNQVVVDELKSKVGVAPKIQTVKKTPWYLKSNNWLRKLISKVDLKFVKPVIKQEKTEIRASKTDSAHAISTIELGTLTPNSSPTVEQRRNSKTKALRS